MSSISDSRLISRYLSGNKQAFGEIVGRYQTYVYNLAYRLSGNASDAEDLTQEVFLKLMAKASQWRGDSKFSTWLYRVAANVCLDRLKARSHETVPLDDYDPPAADDPVFEAEVADLRGRIQAGLLELPAEFRIVVVLRDIDGLTYEEISEALDVAPGTVKSRISRGRAMLAGKLRPAAEPNQHGDRQMI